MYVTIRTYETGDPAEVRRLVVDEVMPNLRVTEGLTSFYLFDSGDGRLSSLTLSESREAAESSSKESAEWVRERFSHLVAGPPVVLAGEVTLEHHWVTGQGVTDPDHGEEDE